MSRDTQGIYVELPIAASMKALWEHTQDPTLHQQWDLRFSSIEYLPIQSEADPQRFLYTTRIGFGIQLSGEGESTGTRDGPEGQRTSALKFWSAHPLSLIEAGSGYWKYIPGDEAIRFLTWYDYQPRFGAAGRLFDRVVFRPLIGWATAWSFDALRLWLEQGLKPGESARRALMYLVTHISLAAIWVYQGLVPKLLFPDSGELAILRTAGIFAGLEETILIVIGLAEIIFGLLFLVPRFGRWLHYLNIVALLALAVSAIFTQPDLYVAPFNPTTLTLAMVALSIIALLNEGARPSAKNCRRRAREK